MLRAMSLSIGLLLTVTPALAATDLETCRDAQADAAARLTACTAVIADTKITGKAKSYPYLYTGDTLGKKRDYDGAIAAFNKALEYDPDNAGALNLRGLAYGWKGEDDRALADYELALQK